MGSQKETRYGKCFKCGEDCEVRYGIWVYRSLYIPKQKLKGSQKLFFNAIGYDDSGPGPKSVKKPILPQVRFGRVFETRQEWLYCSPALEGKENRCNRYMRKRTKLKKWLDGVTGFGTKKRHLRFVCVKCFQDLEGAFPIPSKPVPVPHANV